MTSDRESAPSAAVPSKATRLPYEVFLQERERIIDARQRVQQRTEQLITTGSAGALVLSITFLEKIAPTPVAASRPFLIAAWALLLGSLGCTLLGSFVSQQAFERHLREFTEAYVEERGYRPVRSWIMRARIVEVAGAIAFVAGVAALAVFGLINAPFVAK